MCSNLPLMNYEILEMQIKHIFNGKAKDWNNLYSFLPLSFPQVLNFQVHMGSTTVMQSLLNFSISFFMALSIIQ